MKKTSSIGAAQRLTKRFSEHRSPVEGMNTHKKHKRGISLFDNDNIMNVGLGGRPSSNLFQVQPTTPKKDSNANRRARSIFH